MLLDCQPFVHKHNCSWMLQSGPAMQLVLWGFAVNINIFFQRAVGILMGGLGSLLQLWKKITWCAAVPINAVTESYISFLKHNNYLWGSSVATLKNIIWFILTEQLLAVIRYSIIFPHVNSWCYSSFCLSLWSVLGCLQVVGCVQFPTSLKHNPVIRDLCSLYLNECWDPCETSVYSTVTTVNIGTWLNVRF